MFENKIIQIIQFLLEESNRSKQFDFSDQKLKEKLAKNGFADQDIQNALRLFNYNDVPVAEDFRVKKMRTFHEIEKAMISAKLQGVLLRLKESGLITSLELEALIEEIMLVGQIHGDERAGWNIFNRFFLEKYGFTIYDDNGDLQSADDGTIH